MKRKIHFRRLILTGIIAAAAAWPLAQLANAGPPAPDVPDKIQVDDANKVFLVGHAVGVQIYSCDTVGGGYKWNLVAPRADLYDDSGKVIVTHFGGPTWQAKDGSYVVGRRVDGVIVDETAIPWLKLEAASAAPGPEGSRLAGTTFIQRVATTGGLAPAPAECDVGAVGTTEEIPYTADYYFWKAR